MHIRRASSYRRMPWKNGGGQTAEIDIAPHGAGLGDFHWRISMATMSMDGPFSIFTGIDRTLCIIDGAGIELRIDDEPVRRLDPASEPLSFSGDAHTRAALIDGSITDFNVMTRRRGFRHSVRRVDLTRGDTVIRDRDAHAIFCRAGTVTMATASGTDILEAHDTFIRGAHADGDVTMRAAESAIVYVVTIVER